MNRQHRQVRTTMRLATLLEGLLLLLFLPLSVSTTRSPTPASKGLQQPPRVVVSRLRAALAEKNGTQRQTTDEMIHAPAAVIGEPLIDRVRISPERVCAGRPFVVHVDAHGPGGRDDLLLYGVGEERGNPLVLKRDEPGETRLLVSAFDVSGNYDQRPVAVDVQACGESEAPLAVRLSEGGAPGVAGLEAVLPPRAARDAGWTYSWDFGDGDRLTGTRPYVEHDYRGRDQTRLMSSFLVRVIAKSGRGMLHGMASVPILNLYAMNRAYKGLLVPEVIVQRAGTDDGMAYLEATVTHWERATLWLEEVQSATLVPCSGGPGVPASLDWSMFSTRELRPGATEMHIEIPSLVAGDACGITMELAGPGVNHMPLHVYLAGRFRYMRPPRAVQQPFLDEAPLRARMRWLDEAAALLGKAPSQPGVWISDAELAALVREGRLSPLPP